MLKRSLTILIGLSTLAELPSYGAVGVSEKLAYRAQQQRQVPINRPGLDSFYQVSMERGMKRTPRPVLDDLERAFLFDNNDKVWDFATGESGGKLGTLPSSERAGDKNDSSRHHRRLSRPQTAVIAITLPNGQKAKAKVVGRKLFLINEAGRKRMAPDGRYRAADGKVTITVRQGAYDLGCVNPGTPEEDCWNLIVLP